MRFWCDGVLVLDDAVKMEDPSKTTHHPWKDRGVPSPTTATKSWDGAEEKGGKLGGCDVVWCGVVWCVVAVAVSVTLRWESVSDGEVGHISPSEKEWPPKIDSELIVPACHTEQRSTSRRPAHANTYTHTQTNTHTHARRLVGWLVGSLSAALNRAVRKLGNPFVRVYYHHPPSSDLDEMPHHVCEYAWSRVHRPVLRSNRSNKGGGGVVSGVAFCVLLLVEAAD